MAKDAQNEVAAIEECLVNVKQAASAFTDDVQLTLLSADEIREARESAMAEEKKTSEMIAKAKQSIMTKQIEAKGNQGSPEVSQELMKLQARLSVAQTELGKLRTSFSSVDQQLSSKRVIEEAEQKLKAVEDKVAAITTAISNFVSDEDSPATLQDEKKDLEANLADATLSLRSMIRYLETQMRANHGSARETLSKMEARMKKAQEHLDSAGRTMRENTDKVASRMVLAECRMKVSESEETLQQAIEAERALLDGSLEGMSFEKVMQAANNASTNAKVLMKMKCLAVKRMPAPAAASLAEALAELQSTVDDVSKNLLEMRGRYMEWKKDRLKSARAERRDAME